MLRFGIAWLMAVVAVVALDFGAFRWWSLGGHYGSTVQTLTVGVLPMANALAVALLIGGRRLGRSPFVLGFVVFGAMACVLFVAATILFTGAWVNPYVHPALVPLAGPPGRIWTQSLLLTLNAVVAVMLGFPQLVFALFGGFLFRSFVGWVRRRSRRNPPD